MSKFVGLIFLLSSAITLSACSFSLTGDITPPPGSELPAVLPGTQSVATSPVYPIVPPDLVNGSKIYYQECLRCHGTRGMGDGPQAAQLSAPVAALGLSDFARQYSPAQWYTIVTQGNMEKFMPAFPSLTDRQRWDVVAYAMSLSAPAALVDQGKTIYQQNCVNCHDKSGKGNGPDAGTLASQPKDFTDQAFMAQSSAASLYQAIATGVIPDMPAFTSTLNENERWAVVAYLRSLTFTISKTSASAYPGPTANVPGITASDAYPAPAAYPNPVETATPPSSPTVVVSSTVPFVGSVTVQLTNGSGGDAPSDAIVTLYGFDNMQNTYSETLTTGVNGAYTFTNVTMFKDRAFLAGVDYASGTYASDIAKADPANPDLNLQITVYDSTTDVFVLTTDRVHILFDFSNPKNVNVVEMFIISNPSKQAVVAPTKDGTVVTFPLPQGYTNLKFQTGALGSRYVELSQGFADKITVKPGVSAYQVVFAFQMPYDHKLNFVQPMFLPTTAVTVMLPDNGVKVTSSQLQDSGTQVLQNVTYRKYNGSSLIAGSSLEFSLFGNPKKAITSIFSSGSMQNLAIGVGVFGIATVLGGLWFFRKNQRKVAKQTTLNGMDIASPSIELDASPESQDTLMDAIIALDDQYRSGNLPQEAYLERRAILKEKLRKLIQG
jgi:mono/diheme cytochrome c family protein